MYNENVKNEINEMKDLLERIERLNNEAKMYSGEAAEPMIYNAEKLKDQYEEKKALMIQSYEITKKEIETKFEEKVNTLKENFEKQKQELEGPYNKKIQELEDRIQRLEKEKVIYEKDEEYNESLENNIMRLKEEIRMIQESEGKEIQNILEQKENEMNENIEATKEKIKNRMEIVFKDLEEVGITVETLNMLKEDEEIENVEDEKEQEEIEVEKEQEEVEQNPNILVEKTKTRNKSTQILPDDYQEVMPNITIKYIAKTDEYELIDLDRNEKYIYARTELNHIDKEKISKELNIPIEKLENVNSDIVGILKDFDIRRGTQKLSQYTDIMTAPGLNKKQTKNAMESVDIKIEYDLKGLYKKDIYSKEEIEEILNNANSSKKIGAATVKKGLYTSFRENVDKLVNKMNSIKLLAASKVKALPKTRGEEYLEEKGNKEYWKSIDKKEYKQAIREAQKEKNLRDRLQEIQDERDFENMMNSSRTNIDTTLKNLDKIAKEKTEKIKGFEEEER